MGFLMNETPRKPGEIYEVIQEAFQDVEIITTNKREKFYNVPMAFDIETTSFLSERSEKGACCYGWALGLNGRVILGRTWGEFQECLRVLIEKLGVNLQKRLIIYVHNLSFEFQFIRKRFTWNKIFSIRERTPIYAITTSGIEFRCSYLLSGYSLSTLGKNLNYYPVQKMEGDLDYKLYRTSSTPLTEKEQGYMVHDVLVVMAYIQERMEIDGDITQIQLTKTGYVRKYCRTACFYGSGSRKTKEAKNRYYRYHELMGALQIKPEEYLQLKRAFQGGFTHASAYKSGHLMENVGSIDFKSSYPAVMVAEKYPMSESELIENITTDEFERSLKLYCCMFDVEFYNLREKLLFEHPISSSRCRQKVEVSEDNGRVVSATHIITTMTEQDYMVAKAFYEWDNIVIHNFRRYKKAYLPTEFVASILQLYKDKTELEGVDPVKYAHSKTLINSAFGMTVTDICRDEISYVNDEWGTIKADVLENITGYNKSRNRFLYYPWGVWVTAYARRNLFSGIKEFGEDYIYSDTDSIKAINMSSHQDYIDRYNRRIVDALDRAMKHHGLDLELTRPKTVKGKAKQLGIWDYEGEYKYFKTLGAKRYMVYTDEKGLSLTVSGINKKVAIPYILEQAGGDILIAFDMFEEGLDIPPGKAGKNTHTYIDTPIKGKLMDYLGNIGEYEEYSCVHLEEAGYNLSLAKEYADFLLGIQTRFN